MGGATVAPESWCDAVHDDDDQVQAWLDAYVAAWRSYDRDEIRALFADDVSYAYHPYDEPLLGAEAVVDSWLGEQDAPGTWEAEYAPVLITGDEVDRHRRDALHRRPGVLEPVAADLRSRRALHALRRVVRVAAKDG